MIKPSAKKSDASKADIKKSSIKKSIKKIIKDKTEDEDIPGTESRKVIPKIVGYEPAELDGLGKLRSSVIFSSEAHLYKKKYPTPQAAIEAYIAEHKK